MKKFYTLIILFLMCFSLYFFFGMQKTSEEPVREINSIVIDSRVSEELTIYNLYIDIENEKIAWYFNEADDTYYLFLPKACDRKHLKLEFFSDIPTYLSIYNENNKFLSYSLSGSYVSLTEENYIFKLETNVKVKSEYKVRVLQSSLASVFINIDGGEDSFNKIISDPNHDVGFRGTATFIDLDNDVVNSSIEKIKGRGNATWKREKKPFQVKLTDKTSVLDMKEAKTWILLANYLDGSLSRNALWLYLAEQMEMDYAVEYEPVDLYINQIYQGSYLLTSKVEKGSTRVDLNKGDYLFEIDQYEDENQIKLNHGYVVNTHYPDLDDYSLEDKNTILSNARDYLNSIEDLIYNLDTSWEVLNNAIDLESFAKYYWLQELSLNRDAVRNSFYVYVKSGKLYAGPLWDMDTTLNRSYVYTSNIGYYVLDDEVQAARTYENWYRSLLKREDFSKLVDDVFYKYLPIFQSLSDFLDSYKEKINDSAVMNYIRYPYDKMGDNQKFPWREDIDYDTGMLLLKSDLKTRLDWYISQYESITYDDIFYTCFYNDLEIMSSTLLKYQTMFVPNLTDKIIIYGIKNKEQVVLKEFAMDSECVNNSFDLVDNANSNYKNYLYHTYTYSMCKKD